MMKATGIVRKVDELGRIVLPIELRRSLGIDEGDAMEIFVSNQHIVFKKYAPGCTFCGSVDELVGHIHQKPVCRACVGAMTEVAAGRE